MDNSAKALLILMAPVGFFVQWFWVGATMQIIYFIATGDIYEPRQ